TFFQLNSLFSSFSINNNKTLSFSSPELEKKIVETFTKEFSIPKKSFQTLINAYTFSLEKVISK
ncbi:MAG: hypothetical protein KDK45_17395, partial [Leptospiraceae bacterium]|nr:hypothetical protein [Leptospiraceae bacterium]